MKKIILLFTSLICYIISFSQNIGIGTGTPDAKLHVNGDLRLQNGDPVNKFSRDSMFSENSHNNVPTEKAIKDYIQKGNWINPVNTIAGAQAPAARGIISQWLSSPTAVHTQGTYTYVTSYSDDRLVIFNTGNPDSIYVRDADATNIDGPVDIFVQGNYAYVASENNNRLCIFDVTNPVNIIPKGFISTNIRKPTAVYVQGNYAYVTSDMMNNLAVFDISDPNNIVAKGYTSVGMNLPVDIVVQGNYAYLVSGGNNRLCIYDISNPDAIIAKGFTSTALSYPASVAVQGNYAYVVSRSNHRLCVFNISNPDVIIANGFTSEDLSGPNSISISGNMAFVSNIGFNSINLYDISNPLSLKLKGFTQANLSFPSKVFAIGDYAYVTSYYNNRLCIFDLDKNNAIIQTSSGMASAPSQWQVSGVNTYRSNGNVGIGTSVPIEKLQVAGNTIVQGNIGIGTTETTVPISMASSTGNKVMFYGVPDMPHYGLGIQGNLLQLYTDAAASDIAFGYGNSYSFTEGMRIKGNGNIGIGTTAPTASLMINSAVNPQLHIRQSGVADYSRIRMQTGTGRFWDAAGYNDAGAVTNDRFHFYHSLGGNIFTLTGDGNTGIGNSNPLNPLSFAPVLGKKISLYPGGTGDVGLGVFGGELRLYNDVPSGKISFGIDNYTTGFTELGKFQQNGAYALSVFGSIWANGTTYASDARFKKNMQPLHQSLEKILGLNGVMYEMKTAEFPQRNFATGSQVGLIAQEVEKIIPEVVSTGPDGYKAVDYAKLVPLLIESIKAQQQQIDGLKKLVEKLIKN